MNAPARCRGVFLSASPEGETKKLIRALQASIGDALDRLYELSDEQLDNECTHGCAMGDGVRGLHWETDSVDQLVQEKGLGVGA